MDASNKHTVFTTRWEDIDKPIVPDYHRKHEIEGRKDLLENSLSHFKQLRAIHINMHPDRKYHIIDGVETFLVFKAMGKTRIVVQDHYYNEQEEKLASIVLNTQVSHYSEDQVKNYIGQSFEEFMGISINSNTGIADRYSKRIAGKSPKDVEENIGYINVAIKLSLKRTIEKIIADNGYKNYPGLMAKLADFHEKGGSL